MQESWAEAGDKSEMYFSMKKKVSKGYRKTIKIRGEWEKARVKNFCHIYTVGSFYKKNYFSITSDIHTRTCVRAPTSIAQEINNNIIHRKAITNAALVSHLGDYVWALLSAKTNKSLMRSSSFYKF